jgi:hypothetical protein
MTYRRRGALAALFFSGLLTIAAATSAAALEEIGQRPDGLSYRVVGGGASPTEAIEIWVRCPANGFDGAHPGIARLAALTVADTDAGGASLRDLARQNGGDVTVQVFPAATEIGIVVPAYLAGPAQDEMLTRVLHPTIDDKALKNAKLRMAEDLSLARAEPDIFLREQMFAHLFADGPYRDSTFGTAATLEKTTLVDVQAFLADAFRPARSIAASAGLGSLDAFGAIATSGAAIVIQGDNPIHRPLPLVASADQGQPMPRSTVRVSFAPVSLPAGTSNGVSAVALGWIGPPISDERAATAMDFLSDYLMRDGYGTCAKAFAASQANATFDGQFITLQDPGILFAGVWGAGLDRQRAATTIRAEVQRVVDAEIPGPEFAQAVIAFRAHLLHDMDGPQPLADNVGWYFAQGAPAYTPAELMSGTGDYDAAAKSLTPAFVHATARRYLSSDPALVTSPDSAGSIALSILTQGAR